MIKTTKRIIPQGKLTETVKTVNGKIKEYAYNITKNGNTIKMGGFRV